MLTKFPPKLQKDYDRSRTDSKATPIFKVSSKASTKDKALSLHTFNH